MAKKSSEKPKKRTSVHQRWTEHNAAIFPRMLAMWRDGMSHQKIADILKAEGGQWGVSCRGKPWTLMSVGLVLRQGMDRAEYDAMAGKMMGRSLRDYARGAREAGEKAVSRFAELLRGGMTQPEATAELERGEFLNGRERPYTLGYIRGLYAKRFSKEERRKIAANLRPRITALQHAKVKASNSAVLPRIVELRAAGYSFDRIAETFKAKGPRNSWRLPFTGGGVRGLFRNSFDGKILDGDPVIPADDGKSAAVLGLDGTYRRKALSKAQLRLVGALKAAGTDGLSTSFLESTQYAGLGARGVIARMRKDPDWAAVIYEPDDFGGWRFGPPRSINAS